MNTTHTSSQAQPILRADRVTEIFMYCLFKDGESIDKRVVAEGIVNKVGFDPERLKEHEEEILKLLKELPAEFMRSGGGGWSFLNACNDKHGHQWTGFHRAMEQLFLLGMGIKKVSLLLPREAWGMLPGGMPYYAVEDAPDASTPAHDCATA